MLLLLDLRYKDKKNFRCYQMVHGIKKLFDNRTPPPPLRGGVVLSATAWAKLLFFPFVFSSFSESGSASDLYKQVSVLRHGLSMSILARAHYARKKASKYDFFNVLL